MSIPPDSKHRLPPDSNHRLLPDNKREREEREEIGTLTNKFKKQRLDDPDSPTLQQHTWQVYQEPQELIKKFNDRVTSDTTIIIGKNKYLVHAIVLNRFYNQLNEKEIDFSHTPLANFEEHEVEAIFRFIYLIYYASSKVQVIHKDLSINGVKVPNPLEPFSLNAIIGCLGVAEYFGIELLSHIALEMIEQRLSDENYKQTYDLGESASKIFVTRFDGEVKKVKSVSEFITDLVYRYIEKEITNNNLDKVKKQKYLSDDAKAMLNLYSTITRMHQNKFSVKPEYLRNLLYIPVLPWPN